MLARKTFFLSLVAGALAIVALACAPQALPNAAPQHATLVVEGTPVPQNGPTGEPTRGAKKGPGLQSTPLAGEGPGVAVTPATPPGSGPNLHPPGATVPPVPAPAATQSADEWIDWKGSGYQFRYPRACKVLEHDQSLTIGAGIELTTADPGGLTFIAYLNQLLESRTKAGTWTIGSRKVGRVGGNPALRVEYRFGGTNRYGTAIFVGGKGKVYAWQLTPGRSTCGEATAFEQIVASLRFEE